MKIYKMGYSILRKKMTEFMNTVYGKITFILSYTVSIILSCVLISFIFMINKISSIYFIGVIIYSLLILILISFILGTVHFYHELKEFVEK